MNTLSLPDPDLLQHFPEAAVLAILDTTLAAAELTLRDENPAVDEMALDSLSDIPPSVVTAHLIISRLAELRELLHLYSATILRTLEHYPVPDDIF